MGNIANYLSVLIWSAVWAFAMQCENVPFLFMGGCIAIVWGLIAAVEVGMKDGWGRLLKVSGTGCLITAFGGGGFRLTAFPAAVIGDAVEVAIISCVWLGGAIILGMVAIKERLTMQHAIGAGVLVGGVLLVVMDGIEAAHILALGSGLIWAWYVTQGLVRRDVGREADAVGNLVSGAGLIYLSWLVEAPWDLGGSDILWLCGLIFTESIGYLLWVYGGKHGTLRKAKISVLFTPVGAVLWVCVLGNLGLEMGHIMGTVAVSLAGFILSPYVFRSGIGARLAEIERTR